MSYLRRHLFLAVVAISATACEGAPHDADPLSGGTTTVFDATQGAYANAAANLIGDRFSDFNLGHSLFNRNWVTAPATTADIDGLGPVFNQRSCSGCHSRDGRSPPMDADGELVGMLLRLSIPGEGPHGGPLGDAIYGGQLHPYGILTIPGEGVPHVTYTESAGTYGDGTSYSLQVPRVRIDGWAYGDPSPALMISPRVGNAVFGLGLLEAIPESVILSRVRPAGVDGVAGRANHVWDLAAGAVALGRFGWKASQPSVRQQAAGAMVGDMGITTSLFPDETCTPTMTACLQAPRGGQPDLDDVRLASLVIYMQTLAVPARRDVGSSSALRGERLFETMGCASCHVPSYETGAFPSVPEAEHQTIHPYTDLLLHELGDDLTDGRPDFEAGPNDWRTPPLWGIGLLMQVNGHQNLLHDGRARGLAEAILWHGGEALVARERFRTADSSERQALLDFLNSL